MKSQSQSIADLNRPDSVGTMSQSRIELKRFAIGSFAWALIILCGFTVYARIAFGPIQVALAYLNGEELVMYPSRISLLEKIGRETAAVTIYNLGSHDVQLTGALVPGQLRLFADFPLTVSPGVPKELRIGLEEECVSDHSELTIYTDRAEKPRLIATFGDSNTRENPSCEIKPE